MNTTHTNGVRVGPFFFLSKIVMIVMIVMIVIMIVMNSKDSHP